MTQPDGWQPPNDPRQQPNVPPQQPNAPVPPPPPDAQVPPQPGGQPQYYSGQQPQYQSGQQPQYPSGQLQQYSSGPLAPYGGPPPQYVYHQTVTPPKNDLAVWSLVTGILSWILCPVVLGIVAIIMGHASKRAIKEGQANNSGMATAGLILGWINVGLIGGFFVAWLLFALVAFLGAGVAVTNEL